ncbi:MAG TPA: collagen-like protein [Ferruginibacter sp.]|jgi:hypothetical protein|nr:collagen-like protein [Bacteroidales bacterium]HPH85561.1 collagen-like protein [Ferruginibacter sp.]
MDNVIIEITAQPQNVAVNITESAETVTVNVYDGKPGPAGPQGEPGAPGQPGQDAITYEKRHLWVAPYSYCGVAILGTPESAAAWKITRIEVFLNGTTETKHANNVRWTERQTINYT